MLLFAYLFIFFIIGYNYDSPNEGILDKEISPENLARPSFIQFFNERWYNHRSLKNCLVPT